MITAICLCVFAVSVIASQADFTLLMSTAKDGYYRGDTVSVDIKAAEAGVTDNLGFFSFQVTFDTDKLTLESLVAAEALGGESYVNGTKIDWIHQDGIGTDLGAGTVIAKATFKVKDNAAYGDTSLGFESTFTELDAVKSVSNSVQATGKTITILKLNSVSGQVKSWNPNNDVTVSLKQSGETKYSTTVSGTKTGSGQLTQAFEISGVAAGTYDLVVSKDAHLDYTVTGITVGTNDIDLTKATGEPYALIDMIVGDVNSSKNVNDDDLNIVWNDDNFNLSLIDAANKLTDIDGDQKVNDDDLNIVWNDANFNKGISDCTYSYNGGVKE